MVTDGRGVDAPAAVGVLEVELGLPGEAVADLLPVDQVFGMIDRDSREILERAGYQVVIFSDATDAGVGIEARDDGIHITKLLRLCSRSNGGHRQHNGDEMFVHGKPLFSFLAIAREAFPDTGCESTAGERAEDKDPELLQCITSLEEGGTDGARGIDGSAGVADAGEVHEDEGETDGESGEIAGALLLIGGTEYYEHEYEGEEHLGEQASDDGNTLLACVGAGSGEVNIGGEKSQDGRAEDSAYDLENHVETCILAAHLSGEPYREGDGGIDVAT